MSKVAKLFWNGRSQAVRLPQEFRFEGNSVKIRREGKLVILEPLAKDPVEWLDSLTKLKVEDFMSEGRQQPMPQERKFFK